MFLYELFDGVNWFELVISEKQLVPQEVINMAEAEVKDWDYAGISQSVDIYETVTRFSEDEDDPVYIGCVETPGRRYQCRSCYGIFAHPAGELAVCRCGNVATHEDLAEEEQQAATGQEAEVFAGFVVSESGAYFVQLPQDNEFGFSLFDADQSWPGGIGAARTWTAVARESVPPEVEEELGWILDEGTEPVREEQQAAG